MLAQSAPQPPGPKFGLGEARRMDALESRLSSTEQSNRALLEDIMRLQQEMKARFPPFLPVDPAHVPRSADSCRAHDDEKCDRHVETVRQPEHAAGEQVSAEFAKVKMQSRSEVTAVRFDRLSQIQQHLMDLEGKFMMEKNSREMAEGQLFQRWQQVSNDVSETRRGRDAQSRQMELLLRETSNMSDAEKQKILMQVSAVTQDLRRTIEMKDTKLRQDTLGRLGALELKLVEVQTASKESGRLVKEEVDTKLTQAKAYTEEGIQGVRKLVQEEHTQTQSRLKELSDSQNALEEGLQQTRHEIAKDIAEEEQERVKLARILDGRIEDVSDRLRIGLLSLQTAIGEGKMANVTKDADGLPSLPLEEVEKLQRKHVEGVKETTARQIAEFEEKINDLQLRVEQQDEKLQTRVKLAQQKGEESSTILGDKLEQKLDSLSFSHERLKKQVEDLQGDGGGGGRGVVDLRNKVQDMDGRLTKRIEDESKERTEECQQLRQRLARITGEDSLEGPSLEKLTRDVEGAQTGMRKLAEAVQVVKTTLGDKIKEEKRIREQETSTLRRDVERLADRSKDLKERIKHGGKKPAETK
ncbi:unnamed protein product [Darwinula stevensoni]|uniref:Uncharacterized protein n=1 Tax=Darwinula stevensoni TaxID=69355 RepID=A0A7R8XHZ3_9CRUS|nr:unnamed protein product [Darwinula stevensoni]CAG0892938.1 unnamed protein product [Darwinula stevensoni]